MNRKINKCIMLYAMLFIALMTGCKEEVNGPMSGDGKVPGQVSNVEITPLHGGAEISYRLPDDANLLYVEAVVRTPEGRELKFKSSSQKATIVVEGLATDKEQEVLLYSVSTSEKRSEPLTVKINPLLPSYLAVYQRIVINEGLGGVAVTFENEAAADLAFYLIRKENGVWVEKDSQYTNKVNGRLLFWGYPSEEQEFGVYVRDRWDNCSDTIFQRVTPIPEVMLDKSKFKGYLLDNDGKVLTAWNQGFQFLWDGKWSNDYNEPYTGNGNGWGNFQVDTRDGFGPASFTIDLGVKSQISRIRLNHYWQYENVGARYYELYILEDYYEDNISMSMGAWHNWTLALECENIKPSENGGSAEDDKNAWEAGDEFLLTPPTVPVRYIRFQSIENWQGDGRFNAAELTIYGQPIVDEE